MADVERLLMRGQIAEHAARMEELEHRCANAVSTMRQATVLWDAPADIDVAAIRAAVADLDQIVLEYRALAAVCAQLRGRLGD